MQVNSQRGPLTVKVRLVRIFPVSRAGIFAPDVRSIIHGRSWRENIATLLLLFLAVLLVLGSVVILAESRAKNWPVGVQPDGNCLVLVLNERNLRSQLDIEQRLEPTI